MLGRLGGSAAGDEDGAVFPIGAGGPIQMMIRAAPLPVLPELLILVEAIERSWIRIPFVEVLNIP
jgi:hypothetical protein